MPIVAFSAEQIKGRRVYLLLEIDFGTFGHFRMSTEPLTIPGTGGGLFIGGLDGLTFTDSVDLFATSESNRSVSVSVFLPVDVSELIAQGFDPSRATASLSQYVEGTDYANRRRVLSSLELIDPQYGESYEPFKFSIRSNLYDDGSVIPPVNAVIDGVTFPNSLSWQRGAAYPWIFGTPGKYTDEATGSTGYNYVTPAYVVRMLDGTSKYLIAGHEMTPGTEVNVVKKDAPSTVYTTNIESHIDGLGRLVAVTNNVSASLADEGTDYVASISAGGGVLNDQQTAPRRGMGEVLEYLIDYAPRLNLDRGKTRTAGELLNHMQIDGIITEPVEVWRWLRANLLPFAPVSMATGADGMFPIVWDKDIKESDTVANVDALRDQWERTSPVTVEHLDGEPRNSFSIAYNKSGLTDEMTDRATLSGADKESNVYARTSHKRYGRRDKPEEEAICFYQRSDVDAVLSWWSRIYGFPIRTVEYTAAIDWGWLEAGSSIVFSDSRLNITNQIVIVQAIEWSEEQIIGLRLAWVEDLPRDDRLI